MSSIDPTGLWSGESDPLGPDGGWGSGWNTGNTGGFGPGTGPGNPTNPGSPGSGGNGAGRTGSETGPSTAETPELSGGISTGDGSPKVTVDLNPDGTIKSVVIEGDTTGYDVIIETKTYTTASITLRDRETGLPGYTIPGETVTETTVTITKNNRSVVGENSNTSDTALNWVQGGLDVAGLIPGFGEVADGLNALISLGRGDYAGAALSAAAMIPFAGWGAAGGKFALKYGDEAATFTKSTLEIGRQIHKDYKLGLHNPAKGLFKEFTGIKGIRPDFVDFNTRTIYELKPNNPRAIRDGMKQLDKYKTMFEEQFGGIWSMILDTY